MVHIVSAPRDKGKTSYLEGISLNDDGFGGILALSSGDKADYYALDLESGVKRLLMSSRKELVGPRIGRYRCCQETFDWASSCLADSKCNRIVLDEVGRLELGGEGYAKALRGLLSSGKDLYIAVRNDFVEEVVFEFGIKDYELIELRSSEIEM